MIGKTLMKNLTNSLVSKSDTTTVCRSRIIVDILHKQANITSKLALSSRRFVEDFTSIYF